jgi:transmembrane sensor
MSIEELIIRVARGEATEEQRRRVDAWRSESPRNEESYQDLLHTVRLTQELQADVDTTPVSARSVMRQAQERAREQKVAALPPPRWRGRPAKLAGLAAAMAIAALAIVWLPDALREQASTAIADAPEPTEYRTGPDAGRSIQLASGILAYLGPSSRLEVTDAGPDPRVWLEGRAFFGVEGRADRSVVVETAGGRVTVLGTRFEVHAERDDLHLLVVDGRVEVSTGAEEVQVGSGERGLVTQGVLWSPVRIEDPLGELEWMGRAMVFQSTPLSRVAAEVARRYGVEVEITDPALAQRTLTTVFDDQPLEDVVTIVCGVVQAECSIEDRGENDTAVFIAAQT